MKFINKFSCDIRCAARREGGSIYALVCLFLLILVAVLGLAADWGRTLNQNRDIQYAVDAGTLAGVNRLIPPNVDRNLAESDATDVALANGLSNAEISTVQVGHWDGSTFIADTSQSFDAVTTPYNSVRMTASRQVDSIFMRLLGTDSLTPDVEALALVGERGVADCLIPVGVESHRLLDPNGDGVPNPLQPGDRFVLSRDNPGNWGVVNLDPYDPLNGQPETRDAIANGQCGVPVPLGDGPGYPDSDGYSSATGYDGVCNGFNDRLNASPPRLDISMPVVDDIPNGHHHLRVEHFIRTRIVSAGRKPGYNNGQCNGSNWGVIFEVLGPANSGGEPGGPPIPPFETSRILAR